MAFVTWFFALLLLGVQAGASPGITYHGRLLKPNGQPVISNAVQFRVQIRTPGSSNCLLFEEVHTKDLSKTAGVFSVVVNDGGASSLNTEPFSLAQAFQNRDRILFPPEKCAGVDNEFIPNAADGRMLYVSFNDGTFSDWEPLPPQSISFVPYALETVSVGGYRPSNFFRVVDGDTVHTVPSWTSTNYQKLLDLIANTTTTPGGDVTIGGPASGFTGNLDGDVTGTQEMTSVVRLQGRDVSATAPSNGQMLGWNHAASRWEPLTPSSTATPVGAAGGDLTGTYPDPVIAANAVTESKITNGAITTAKFQAGSAAGQIFRFDGADWQIAPLNYRDLVNNNGVSPWNFTACAQGQALGWQSASDSFVCENLLISTSNLEDGSITNGKIADGAVTTTKIGNAQVTDAKIATVSVNKIVSGPGLYLTYAPNNVACTNGDVLKKTANGWECGSDNNAGGTVTNVSGTAPISVATGTTTPVISLNTAGVTNTHLANGAVNSAKIQDGTIATVDLADGSVTDAKIAAMAASKLTGTIPAANFPALTGDVTNTAGSLSLTVTRMRGRTIAATAPANGQVLKWNNSLSQWEPSADNNAGGTVTSVSATAPLTVTNGTTTPNLALTNGSATGQMLRWSGSAWQASTDGSALTALNASNLSSGSLPAARIAAGTITSSHIANGTIADADIANGTISAGKLASTVANGLWTVSGANIGRASGNVGVGTTSPGQKLDVVGTIRGTSILVGANAVWHAGNFNPSSYQLALGYTPVNRAGDTVTGNFGVNGSFLMSGNTVIDGGGGWHRSYGNSGWYSQTYGGGIFMQDSTYVRVYGGKVFHSDNTIQSSTSMNAPAFYYTSDRRLKEDIQPIQSALDKVLSLNGVTFTWKKSHQKDIGFIAQEVEKVAPELIGERPDEKLGTVKTVKYGNIVAIVIEAVKDLFKISEGQESRIKALENENAELRAINRQVLERLNALEQQGRQDKPSRGLASED